MKTRIVCHRGACRKAPENTIKSALTAKKLGGDIVELDVRQSKDGVLYLLHDETVDRTTNFHGPIAELASARLDILDAGSWFDPAFAGEPLPRLDDFIDAIKGKLGFYFEIKEANAEAVARTIQKAGIEAESFTYSETAPMRAAMAEAAPWLKRMINWQDIEKLDNALTIGARIIEFHSEDVTSEKLASARAAKLEIMIHTTEKDEDVFRSALIEDVDYLNIDFPEIAAHLRSELA